LPLHALSVRGLRGQRGLARVLAPFKLVWAVFEALGYLRKIRPALCIGFGGYPAAPGGVAAKLLAIPVIVHEQNAVAGMTNRLLARLSQRVATAFPGVLPDAHHVGNPVREGIESLGLARVAGGHQSGASIRVLVLGGSQGARAFNHALPSLLSPLIQRHGLVVRHQSGDAMHAEVVGDQRVEGGHANEVPGLLRVDSVPLHSDDEPNTSLAVASGHETELSRQLADGRVYDQDSRLVGRKRCRDPGQHREGHGADKRGEATHDLPFSVYDDGN